MQVDTLGHPASNMGPRLRAYVEAALLRDLHHYGIQPSLSARLDWSNPCQEGHCSEEFLDGSLESMSDVRVLDGNDQPIAAGWIDFVQAGYGMPLHVFWLFLDGLKETAAIPQHVWGELTDAERDLVAAGAAWARDPSVSAWRVDLEHRQAELIDQLEAPVADGRAQMARLEAEASVGELIGALERAPRPLSRQLAADLLGRRADAAAADWLQIRLAGDVDARVRASAADALGKILLTHGAACAPDAGAVLLQAFDAETDQGVRHMLAAALGAAGAREAIPRLQVAAASQDRGLAIAANWALEQLKQSKP